MTEPRARGHVRFDTFELDLDTGNLTKQGRSLKLQPQPGKLLAMLVRKSGAVVTREEIQNELWPDGTFVDFDQSIKFCIKRIREVLAGNDSEAERWFLAVVNSTTERLGWPILYVRSFYHLARIHQARGDAERAGHFYRRYWQHWKDGDLDRDRIVEAAVAIGEETSSTVDRR